MNLLTLIAALAVQSSQVPLQYDGVWPPLGPLSPPGQNGPQPDAPPEVTDTPSAVPTGPYADCAVLEGGEALPAPFVRSLTIQEIENYQYLEQPGRYAFDNGRIIWLTGPLAGAPPAEYLPDRQSETPRMVIRFQPAAPFASQALFAGYLFECALAPL